MTASHLITAQQGEERACDYLQALGFRILARNYRCRLGELDIVAQLGGVLHVVEVKTRSRVPDDPLETVRPAKRRRLLRIARCFIQTHALDHLPCQLDLITVQRHPSGRLGVEFFEDAFGRTE